MITRKINGDNGITEDLTDNKLPPVDNTKMADAIDTPIRSGRSVDGSSTASTSVRKSKKKGNTTNDSTKKQKKKMKEKKQAQSPHHPNTNYLREYQLRYDARIKLDELLGEAAAKIAMVLKFKSIFKRVKEEESSAVLYPYLTSSSAVPITAVT